MADHPLGRETEWLFQRLNTLEQQMIDRHASLRNSMETGFAKVSLELHAGLGLIDGRITKNTERIIIVETERGMEKSQAMKRGALAGILAASGLTVVAEAIKHAFGLR